MKHIYIALFLFLSVVGVAWATMLINEDFEGAGTPSGWLKLGSADFDYSAAPLAGLQSLRCDSATSDSGVYLSGGALNNSELWFTFLYKSETLPASFQIITTLSNSSVGDDYRIYILSSGQLAIADNGGGIFAVTTDALTQGTIYSIWGHYKKGTGSNAVCEGSFDVAGNPRPNSGTKWAGGTNGVTTNNVDQMLLSNNSSGISVFDNVQVCDTDCFAGGPTPTSTPTNTPTPTATATSTSTPTPTVTATPTNTPATNNWMLFFPN